MRLSAPRVYTWVVGLVLLILGLLAHLGTLSALGSAAFWLVVAGLALLLLAPLVKGL